MGVGDPVATGIVARLDRPSGNTTGFGGLEVIDISGGATVGVHLVGSVGEQAAFSGKVRLRIDRRYVVPGCRRYDRRAMRERPCIRIDNKAASRLAPKGDDDRFDFSVAMNGRCD